MDIAISKIGEMAVNVRGAPSVKPVAPSPSPTVISQTVDNEAVKQLAENIQKNLDSMSINLAFSTYGKDGEKIAVTVTEKETGKVIREIPSEEVQRLTVKMEEMVGMIFNGRV